jgi:GNAT superfamily N-acetyltransferase
MNLIHIKRVDAFGDPAVWALIAAMDAQCFTRDMADALGDNQGVWWIAYVAAPDGLKPAGYLCLKERASNVGEVPRVGVIPEFRGKGIQKELLRAALAYARRRGVESVVAYTARKNLPSANSFIATGFRLFDPKPKWGFRDAHYWRKILKKGTT